MKMPSDIINVRNFYGGAVDSRFYRQSKKVLLKIKVLIVVLLITFFSLASNHPVFANDTQLLQLESLTIEGFSLNPIFESHRYNYRIEMNEAIDLNINAIPKDPNAEVKISGFE